MVRSGDLLTLEEYEDELNSVPTFPMRVPQPRCVVRNERPDVVSEVLNAHAIAKAEAEVAWKRQFLRCTKHTIRNFLSKCGWILGKTKFLVLMWIGIFLIMLLSKAIPLFLLCSLLVESESIEYYSYFGQELKFIKKHEVKLYSQYDQMVLDKCHFRTPRTLSKANTFETGGFTGFLLEQLTNWILN